MDKVTDRELNIYYSRISDAVICDRRQKKAFMTQLKDSVKEYISDMPDATMQDIEKAFGTPESISGSFIENTDSSKIKRQIQIKKVLVISIIAALIIYALFVVISLIDVHREAHGYFEEGFLSVSNIIKGGDLL